MSSSAPESASTRTVTPSGDWQESFLRILHNKAKRRPSRNGARTHGFVVVATGTESLQHVQELCHSPAQTYTQCFTARYSVDWAPLPGSLIAAFVADLAALRSGRRTVAQLLPAPEPDSPWSPLANDSRLRDLDRDFAAERTGEHLDDVWLDRLFHGLAKEQNLHAGSRLVLLAEASDSRWLLAQGDDALRALAARLPERCGLVLTAPGLAEPTRIVDPSFAYLDVSGAELPSRSAARYVEVAFTGDQLAATDALGRDHYAAALANLVMLPDTGPLTIGIHAPWGMGKSSFMRFVEEHLLAGALTREFVARNPGAKALARTASERLYLRTATSVSQPPPRVGGLLRRWGVNRARRTVARRVISIWFNAWQYEGANQIWAGLTHQITQAMERSMPWWRRLGTRIGYSVQRRGAQFWLGVFTPLVVAALVAGLSVVLGVGGALAALVPKDVRALAAALPATIVTALGVLLVLSRFFSRVKPVSEGLLDYVRQPNYRDHMGYQHQVLEDIRYLAGRLRRKDRAPRVVVFIDDLDRCSDEKVLETLQAINLLLTASGCYVFLGIDTDMIIRAIQRHFDFEADPQDKARGYLRKILQMNLRLHPPAPGTKLGFLDEFFSDETRDELATMAAPAARREARPAPGHPPRPWDLAPVAPPARYAVQLNEVADTVHELWSFHQLADLVPTNPRELKRLVNVHRLVKIVLMGAGVHPSAADQRLLVGWLLFCFDAPLHAAVVVARARRTAGAGDDRDDRDARDQVVEDTRLAAILTRLGDDPFGSEEDAGPLRLTAGQLLPGTQFAEAWEISSLFRMSA